MARAMSSSHRPGGRRRPEQADDLTDGPHLELQRLGAGALLRPVGSFAGSGEDPLFDLGGNAAEWTVAKNGAGKVLGGSADKPADSKEDVAARPDYIGFRVVKDAK